MTQTTSHSPDPEQSCDHFGAANGAIFQKIKMEKIVFKVMATI